MQCPRCQQGSPLPDAQFCPRCGAPGKRFEESGLLAASYADLRRDLTEVVEQQTAASSYAKRYEQDRFGHPSRAARAAGGRSRARCRVRNRSDHLLLRPGFAEVAGTDVSSVFPDALGGTLTSDEIV